MLRGCQKKIVFLKNTGSKHFDEAYFVISEEGEKSTPPDLIKEANRIIDENVFGKEKTDIKESLIKKIFKNRIIIFILGVLTSVAFCTTIILILK